MKDETTSRLSRRSFVIAAAGAVAVSAPALRMLQAAPAGADPLEVKLAADAERPQFHLLPARGWMNDPNGPIYYRGQYHMFFQYNPHGAVWGDISWDHAVSPDMMHWRHLPVALTPTPGGPDAAGCFSGSCITADNRVYAVYTGVVHASADATIRDGANTLRESQCLAWSDDPMLVKWTKDPKPIVPNPPPGLAVTGFRDPSAWRQDNGYYMTVGSGVAKQGGCVLLYHSPDLKTWTYLHPLDQGKWAGGTAKDPVDSGEMWECPEFFALDGGHVLIYSTRRKVYWQSGELDTQAMVFHPKKDGMLDLGNYYAPKTQLDAEGLRILWGWIPEARPVAAYQAAGWAGMMSLPRVLTLQPDGELRMQMLPALSTLRGDSLAPGVVGGVTSVTLPSANGEVECTASTGHSPFSLSVTQGSGGPEILSVHGMGAGTLTADGQDILLSADEAPHVHLFVDASVVSVIINSRIGYTRRFYGGATQAPDVMVRVTGQPVQMQAWKVRPISDNRLTSPA